MHKTDLVMFDLGRVLIDFDFRLAIHHLERHTSLQHEEIHDFFMKTPLWDTFEKGKVSPEQFFSELRAGLQLNGLDYHEFTPLWNNIFTEKEDTVALMRRLRKKYRTALVSNVNVLHWEFIESRHPFLKEFDWLIPSYAVGTRKPEPEIFHLALERAGVRPENAVFTDDLEVHIHAANAIGIRAVQFTNAAQLEKDWAHLL